MSAATTYTESSIRILEGLEPVKLRPGQFTRTDSPLHIVQEVLDNAVDEAIAGFAKTIRLTLTAAGGVIIEDDGRGIPVGLHPEKRIPVVQAIFTVLYSGGKFDKTSGGGAYGYAGGLHGVGVSVTNALCQTLRAEVVRDGWRWAIEFSNGDVTQPLKKVERAEGSGTRIEAVPNPKYFDSPSIPAKELRELLRSKAVLLPGLTTVFRNESQGEAVEETYAYEQGMVTYLQEQAGREALTPVIEGAYYFEGQETVAANGEGAAWAFSWYQGDGGGQSYVNLIPTPAHGTHVAGLRAAVFGALKEYIDHHGLLPKGVKLTAEDAFKQSRFVLSARLLDPSFDNQTKDRLNSRDALRVVERAVMPQLQSWLEHNPAHAKVLADLVIQTAMARQRASVKAARPRGSSVVMLPGKLTDCESQDLDANELFLVEGDSAGGSAKQARMKDTQAILPLRGKGLNTWEKTSAEALTNTEVADIATALGVQPHKQGESADLSKLRYGKVCILSDADVDGFHIQVLLLTLFYKHFYGLIEAGRVYVARPPLYRLDAEGSGKKRPSRKVYAMDEAELASWQDRLKGEGYSEFKVSRFKGLGEMNPPDLWETTLCPDTRRLLQVQLPPEGLPVTSEMFENLMAKGQAGWRRSWMERRGDEVTAG